VRSYCSIASSQSWAPGSGLGGGEGGTLLLLLPPLLLSSSLLSGALVASLAQGMQVRWTHMPLAIKLLGADRLLLQLQQVVVTAGKACSTRSCSPCNPPAAAA